MIYVLEAGEYSDKRIVMATTNREFAYSTAGRMEREIHGGYKPVITVHELEDGVEAHYLPMWRVELWESPVSVTLEDYEDEEQEWSDTYFIRASSAEVALKIARDKQAKRKAELDGLV